MMTDKKVFEFDVCKRQINEKSGELLEEYGETKSGGFKVYCYRHCTLGLKDVNLYCTKESENDYLAYFYNSYCGKTLYCSNGKELISLVADCYNVYMASCRLSSIGVPDTLVDFSYELLMCYINEVPVEITGKKTEVVTVYDN